MLRDRGWSTLHVGKWHVNLAASNGPTGPYHNWPTNRGFERAYWFQGHSTDYFKPSELIDGVTPVEAEEREDYFVNDALTDRAIAYVRTQKAARARQALLSPALLSGGALAAAGARRAIATRTRAPTTRAGTSCARKRLERQRALGVVPATTQLPPLSPGADAWDTLDATQKRVYARYMEVYAGLITNLDANIGRFLDVARRRRLAREHADRALLRQRRLGRGHADRHAERLRARVRPAGAGRGSGEALRRDGRGRTFPHYPIGWACVSNTPFRLYKQYAHLGGVADPLIVSWPSRIAARGEIRTRFVHVIDLYPDDPRGRGRRATRDLPRPPPEAGRRREHRRDLRRAPTAPTRSAQYFELGGQRGYLDGNWRLVDAPRARHGRSTTTSGSSTTWRKDPNELVDLAAEHPGQGGGAERPSGRPPRRKYGVFPLDDRNLVIKLVQDRQRRGVRAEWELRAAARAPRQPGGAARRAA